MRKLFLAALLGIFSFAANANNRITINNNLGCPQAHVTVQFVSYHEGTCEYDITSPIFQAQGTYDLCDPSTWTPGTLWMPSYETFSVIICITCPDGTQYCLPPIGIDQDPGRRCDQDRAGPINVPCCGLISAEVVVNNGGGSCFSLNIHH